MRKSGRRHACLAVFGPAFVDGHRRDGVGFREVPASCRKETRVAIRASRARRPNAPALTPRDLRRFLRRFQFGDLLWIGHLLKRITFNPEIFGGKPIIRGRRLAVEHVLGMLAAGDSAETILEGYPWLEPEDVQACLIYACRVVGRERIELVPAESSQ